MRAITTNRKTVLLCLCSVVVGVVVGGVWSALPPGRQATFAQVPTGAAATAPGGQPMLQLPAPPTDDLTPEEQVNVRVYEIANRSAVNITTRTVQSARVFMMDVPVEGQGEGSGIIVDREGHVVTNNHVIEGARDVRVTLFDGTSYEAKLVGMDTVTDVALLKIDAPPESLYPVTLGNSSRLKIGQRVFAIGNPFGFERTLTTGVISSLNRTLPGRKNDRKIRNLIQIDAAINPGNSGGPLLDTHGRMIGMNMAIASRTGESAGVGFAIPVNAIARVIPSLIANGRVIRADIGIWTVFPTRQGLLIRTLAPGGPAEKAGLRGPRIERRRKQQGPFAYDYVTVDRSAADLIVAINGKPATDVDEVLSQIESKNPGDQAIVTIVREGKQMDVPVTLSAGEP